MSGREEVFPREVLVRPATNNMTYGPHIGPYYSCTSGGGLYLGHRQLVGRDGGDQGVYLRWMTAPAERWR